MSNSIFNKSINILYKLYAVKSISVVAAAITIGHPIRIRMRIHTVRGAVRIADAIPDLIDDISFQFLEVFSLRQIACLYFRRDDISVFSGNTVVLISVYDGIKLPDAVIKHVFLAMLDWIHARNLLARRPVNAANIHSMGKPFLYFLVKVGTDLVYLRMIYYRTDVVILELHFAQPVYIAMPGTLIRATAVIPPARTRRISDAMRRTFVVRMLKFVYCNCNPAHNAIIYLSRLTSRHI